MPSQETQLRIERCGVNEIIERMRTGRIMVPEFQRDYVWQPKKAAELLDSLFHKFPVGCFLIWRTYEKVETRERKKSRASASTDWLIDGQQRAKTLEKISSGAGDDGLDLYFNVLDPGFKRADATVKRNQRYVSVAAIWSDDWRSVREDAASRFPGQRLLVEKNIEQCREIQQYEVPIVEMENHSLQDAVTAFRRINTKGTRLGSEDLKSAELAGIHSSFIQRKVIPFVLDLQREGFDRLNVSHLFRVAEEIADPGRRVALHELTRRDLETAWARTQSAFAAVQKLVGQHLGVFDMSVMWSGALLVPPMVALSLEPKTDHSFLAGWIALAALHHRYSKSSETALDQDIKACSSSDVRVQLLRNIRRSAQRKKLLSHEGDFDANIQDKGVLFALWVACHQNNAVDLFTGKKLSKKRGKNEDPMTRHHIVARAQFDANNL